jgi:hypothetical protein
VKPLRIVGGILAGGGGVGLVLQPQIGIADAGVSALVGAVTAALFGVCEHI